MDQRFQVKIRGVSQTDELPIGDAELGSDSEDTSCTDQDDSHAEVPNGVEKQNMHDLDVMFLDDDDDSYEDTEASLSDDCDYQADTNDIRSLFEGISKEAFQNLVHGNHASESKPSEESSKLPPRYFKNIDNLLKRINDNWDDKIDDFLIKRSKYWSDRQNDSKRTASIRKYQSNRHQQQQANNSKTEAAVKRVTEEALQFCMLTDNSITEVAKRLMEMQTFIRKVGEEGLEQCFITEYNNLRTKLDVLITRQGEEKDEAL